MYIVNKDYNARADTKWFSADRRGQSEHTLVLHQWRQCVTAGRAPIALLALHIRPTSETAGLSDFAINNREQTEIFLKI